MAQLCDPCFKAVKLQKPEFKKKLATTSDTDTPNTNPTSPTKDCSQMLLVTFLFLVVAILIGVFIHFIRKDGFLSKLLQQIQPKFSFDFFGFFQLNIIILLTLNAFLCLVSKELGTVDSKISPDFIIDEILNITYFDLNIWRINQFQKRLILVYIV